MDGRSWNLKLNHETIKSTSFFIKSQSLIENTVR